jgi:hypothetical protein
MADLRAYPSSISLCNCSINSSESSSRFVSSATSSSPASAAAPHFLDIAFDVADFSLGHLKRPCLSKPFAIGHSPNRGGDNEQSADSQNHSSRNQQEASRKNNTFVVKNTVYEVWVLAGR